MKVLGMLVGLAVGLSLLLVIVAGGYFLFRYSVEMFGMLEPRLATLTAIIAIAAFICCSIIAGGLKTAKQQGVVSSVFNIKETLYKQLLSHWVYRIQQRQDMQVASGKSGLDELERLLALHAGPKVISAYLDLCRLAEKKNQDESELSMKLIKLVTEMRYDLGSPAMIFKEADLADLLLRRY